MKTFVLYLTTMLVLAFSAVCVTTPLYGQVPQKISYQGLLTTASGSCVADGDYSLKFEFFNVATDGDVLATFNATGVPIHLGAFSVVIASLPSRISESLYLQVTAVSGPGIESPVTFAPRTELTSAPYSLRSDTASYAISAGSTGGIAGGDLTGSYPNPEIAAGTINRSDVQPTFKAPYADTADFARAALPGGTAGGVLAGTYPNPTINSEAVLNVAGLSTNGNIGIGISSPSHKLDVQGGDINISGSLRVGGIERLDASGNFANVANITASGSSIFAAGPSSSLTFQGGNNSSGGIGGVVSLAGGAGAGPSGGGGATLQLGGGGPNYGMGGNVTLNAGNQGSGNYWDPNRNGSIVMQIAGTEYMRVDGFRNGYQGFVGIGTTVPEAKLQVGTSGDGTSTLANAWGTFSSRRWKTNIQTLEGALDKIGHIRGVSYDWKTNGKHDIGVIAEEIGQVFPEIVSYESNGTDARAVDYSRLVAVLIEGIKSQQQEIEELRQAVRSLVAQTQDPNKAAPEKAR